METTGKDLYTHINYIQGVIHNIQLYLSQKNMETIMINYMYFCYYSDRFIRTLFQISVNCNKI